MKKKIKINDTFFILSFIFIILSFSIGVSVIDSYNEKLEMYDIEKNKLLLFQGVDYVSSDDLLNVLDDRNITITLKKFNNASENNKSYYINTIIKNDSFDLIGDISSGKKLSQDDYKSEKNIAMVSLGLKDEDITIPSKNPSETLSLEKIGVYYEGKSELYTTNKIFANEVIGDNTINSSIETVISGEKDEIDKAIKSLENYFMENNIDTTVKAENYFIDDKSLEGDLLLNSSIIILVITIINSIALTGLWIEEKRKELVLRKVCGANNKNIMLLYYKNLLRYSVVAFIISMLIQFIISYSNSGTIMGLDIRLGYKNILLSLLLSVVLALVISFPSMRYITKIQPVESLRED